MKVPRTAMLAFLVFAAPTALAQEFDYSVLHGEWGAYEDNLIRDDWYTYLEFGPTGGTYSYSYDSGSTVVIRFDQAQVVQNNGLLLIDLSPGGKCSSRLVVSAFRTERGSALLTGSLYMFRCEGGTRTLFNTIPQRMSDLGTRPELAAKIRSAMTESDDR